MALGAASALESTSFGQNQAAAEALLWRHLRLERAVRAFGAELRRLDEPAGRLQPGRRRSWCTGTDRAGTQTHGPPTSNVRAVPALPWSHRGWKWEGICGP